MGALGLLIAVTASSAAEMRIWTFEKSGKTMQAEVTGFAGTNMVTLKGADGKAYSVPIPYLVESNRVYLAAELAEKWKEVEVVRLEGTASGGRYKRCSVRGKGVGDVILVDLLPPAVETILQLRNQKAAEIAQLQSWINSKTQAVTTVELIVQDPNAPAGYNTNAVYRLKDEATLKAEAALTNLYGLEAAYSNYNAETRTATTVKMKRTGLVYQGLPVWECFDPRKRQQ